MTYHKKVDQPPFAHGKFTAKYKTSKKLLTFYGSTQQNGQVFKPYVNDCSVRYNPKLLKAGTVTIYDQSLEHCGMANKNRNLKRRYILDLSYKIGNVLNEYGSNYPKLAQEHVRRYREKYGNLNIW